MQINVVVPHRCLLGEGPVWDTKRNVICWVDILRGEFMRIRFNRKNIRLSAIIVVGIIAALPLKLVAYITVIHISIGSACIIIQQQLEERHFYCFIKRARRLPVSGA